MKAGWWAWAALVFASSWGVWAAPPSDKAATAPPASVSSTEVPFYPDWARSPHANHSAEAFNHWNKEGAIPPECAKCHSTPGFRDFLGADGSTAGVVDHPAPTGSVITCVACHNEKTPGLTSVTFPSGLKVQNLGHDAVCMTCHQGVESTASVAKATANAAEDAVQPKLEFLNVHYRAAGAMLLGTLARVAYEYPGKTYVGRSTHPAPFNGCTACHDTHTVEVKTAACVACHKQATDRASLRTIRMRPTDYDGSGDGRKGVAQEIDSLRGRLYSAIVSYAKSVSGKPIVYDLDTYPYYFIDTNGNGVADKEEIKFPNRYNAWTPRLLKAAYNYQFVTKEPGAYAHNPPYAAQILHDSISDLGVKVAVDLGKAARP